MLQVLILQGNKLKSFDSESLRHLSSLKYLNLEENCLRTMTPFPQLFTLKYLSLAHNTIRDLAEFENLNGLENLQTINLLGNPVTKKHPYRQPLIHKLHNLTEIDGKEISQDERDRIEAQYAPKPAPTIILQESIQLTRGGIPQYINKIQNDTRIIGTRNTSTSTTTFGQYVDPINRRTSAEYLNRNEVRLQPRHYSYAPYLLLLLIVIHQQYIVHHYQIKIDKLYQDKQLVMNQE